MKYVRTKDEVMTEEDYCVKKEIIKEMDGLLEEIYKEETFIVKQAETIEELCDVFVAVDKKEPRNTQFISLKEFWLSSLGMNLEYIYYYGAIWTEWGLKYVAKMNEKGELELL